jgi:5-methylcytosine-specific restriction endonuclease McrA
MFPIKDLSLDHVVPRSKGGKLTWTNTVTACLSCNSKKGQTAPQDLGKIGMKLRMLPRIPSNNELQSKAKIFKKTLLHPHWSIYV